MNAQDEKSNAINLGENKVTLDFISKRDYLPPLLTKLDIKNSEILFNAGTGGDGLGGIS